MAGLEGKPHNPGHVGSQALRLVSQWWRHCACVTVVSRYDRVVASWTRLWQREEQSRPGRVSLLAMIVR